jgi:RHS repeat-associated protein
VLTQEDIVWSEGAGGGGSSDQSSYQSSFEDEFAFWQAVNAVMAGFGEAEARAARDNKLAQIANELLLLPPDEQARAMDAALAELGGEDVGAAFFALTLDDSGGYRAPAVSAGSTTAQTTSGGGASAQSATSTVLWLLPDNLGTTRDVIDNSGALVNHITYAAFGAITAITGASGQPLTQSPTRYLYTQRELDPTTHLNYHRARYYDPSAGRWLSEDPIGFAAGDANLARFVHNSPADFADSSGLSKKKVGGGTGTPNSMIPSLPAQTSRYWLIVFSSYNPTRKDAWGDIGHAFVAIVDLQAPTQEAKVIVRGFHPKAASDALREACAGDLVDDTDHRVLVARGYPITKEQYDELLTFINATRANPPQYDLQDYNCTTWAIEVMKKVGHGYGVQAGTVHAGGDNDPDARDYTPANLGDFLIKDETKNSILFDKSGGKSKGR